VTVALRPYQMEAVRSLIGELSYRPSTLAVMSTGSGKTHVFAALTRIWLKRGGKRVWVTAPRGELLDQARRTIKLWNPSLSDSEIGREQGSDRAHDGNRVVLASLQSLNADRIGAVPPPDLIVVDEAHLHLDQVRSLAEAHPHAKRVGMTATPDRSDVRAIMPQPFESLPARQIYELPDAIKDGYLTKPVFRRIILEELDALAEIPQNGDFAEGSLSQVMSQPEVVAHCARAILDQYEGRQSVAFCVDISHAEKLQAYLAPHGAELIHGGMNRDERARILSNFSMGKTPILVSVMLLSYGVDLPNASCGILLRPTKSRPLYSQMVGRFLRLYPGKEDALILDFTSNSQELGLVTPDDLLYGEMEAIDGAPEAINADWTAEEDLEEQLLITAAELPPMPAEGQYRVIQVETQLSCIGVSAGYRHELDPPATWAQLDYLRKFKVDGEGLSMDQASSLIDELLERARAGWATIPQARLVQKWGLNPIVKFTEAESIIARVKANNWRVPPAVRVKYRVKGEKAVVSR